MNTAEQLSEHANIFQRSVPYDVTPRALPGIRPAAPDEWLLADDAFADQMAYRANLIATRRDRVHVLQPEALPAAVELLDAALDLLRDQPNRGYTVETTSVLRPDGVSVPIDKQDPLATLGHLVQEDLCILEKQGDEHVLTGAVLCFPASWTLSEKFQRPLTRIHDPVPEYDDRIARRVQRLFDGVQVGRPLWRFNALWYAHPDLHQPRTKLAPPREIPEAHAHRFFRTEKQVIFRLPRTDAVIFSIHTFVLPKGVMPHGLNAP